jgi:hypothetical protein
MFKQSLLRSTWTVRDGSEDELLIARERSLVGAIARRAIDFVSDIGGWIPIRYNFDFLVDGTVVGGPASHRRTRTGRGPRGRLPAQTTWPAATTDAMRAGSVPAARGNGAYGVREWNLDFPQREALNRRCTKRHKRRATCSVRRTIRGCGAVVCARGCRTAWLPQISG